MDNTSELWSFKLKTEYPRLLKSLPVNYYSNVIPSNVGWDTIVDNPGYYDIFLYWRISVQWIIPEWGWFPLNANPVVFSIPNVDGTGVTDISRIIRTWSGFLNQSNQPLVLALNLSNAGQIDLSTHLDILPAFRIYFRPDGTHHIAFHNQFRSISNSIRPHQWGCHEMVSPVILIGSMSLFDTGLFLQLQT